MTRARNSHRLASYWAARQPARTAEPRPVEAHTEPDPAPPARPNELRHGYTLTDLHQLARLAVHTAGTMATDWRERYDTAYSAIAEELYAAEHPPARHDLVRAGQLAIYAAVDDDRQAYGYYRRKTDGAQHGAFSSPAFRTYWRELIGATGSPERRVVERHTLAQIIPTLTAGQQQALLALAAHNDYQVAARALGLTDVAFKSQISNARRRFLALWHEGEQPSKPWGCDRRAGVRAGTRRAGGTAAEAIRRRARAAKNTTGAEGAA